MINIRKKGLIFLNVFILFCCTWLLFGIYYETNDDAILSNIANGAYGTLQQNLIYVNIVFSYLLKFLYLLFPGINFIVIIQYILIFCSICTLYYIFTQKFGFGWGLAISNLVFCLFAVELLTKFQYVKTSTLILVSGLSLIALSLSKWNKQYFWGLLLVILGCQIRFESFISAGALAAFTLLFYFFKLNKNQKKQAVLQMFLLFFIVFSLEGINKMYYANHPEWQEYDKYNQARTTLVDYKENYLPANKDNILNLGYSENDFQMLSSRNFFDNAVFPTEKIEQINRAIPPKDIKSIVKDFLNITKNLFRLYGEQFFRIGFIISILCLVFAGKKSRLFVLGTMGMFFALYFYLMTVNRFMNRIEVLLIFTLTINCLLVFEGVSFKNKYVYPLITLGVAALMLYQMPTQYQYQKNKQRAYLQESIQFEQAVQDMAQNKQNLYLFDPVQTNYFAGYQVFHPRPQGFFSNICPTGGWLSNSAFTNSVLNYFQIKSPLIDSVNKENVFISNVLIDVKLKYVQEHFDANVYYEKVTDNGVCDYQFKTR